MNLDYLNPLKIGDQLRELNKNRSKKIKVEGDFDEIWDISHNIPVVKICPLCGDEVTPDHYQDSQFKSKCN